MAQVPPHTDTAGTPDPEGVVSGAVLRHIRASLGLTQEQTAEAINADVNTIKGWESGRRPLARVSVQRLRAVTMTLRRLGVPATILGQLDTAIDVDLAIGQIIAVDQPDGHPLGTWVHTKVWHDLLGWALAGTPPAALSGAGQVPRPRLAEADQAHLFNNLRAAAEQAPDSGPAATLLRRQVFFVSAWDRSPASRDWLAKAERREVRRLRRSDDWTPAWVAGRSLAVARACQGDPEPLRRFIGEQLASDRQEAANLNYWAYWAGEHAVTAVSDEFMAADLAGWRGGKLLAHLVGGLSATTPYLDLTVHTVWSLVQRRPWLLDETATAADLRGRTTALLAGPAPGPQARRELDQLHYLTLLRRER